LGTAERAVEVFGDWDVWGHVQWSRSKSVTDMDKVVGMDKVWGKGLGNDEFEWVVHSFGEGGSVNFFGCFVAAFWATIWGTTLRASVLDDWSITVFAEWSIHWYKYFYFHVSKYLWIDL